MQQKRLRKSYSTDRPIRSEKEDILGRATFASRLADDLHLWKGNDSLVIALYGNWGSGKTSVKNMLLERNQKKGRPPFSVVDFNPWQLSGTGGIPHAFFRELVLALKTEGPKSDVEKREKTLNAYAATLAIASTTANLIGKVMPMAGIPGGPILESLADGMKLAEKVTQEGGQAVKAKNETESKSLEDQKRQLAKLLTKLPKPLLVVIDDIDRLTTDEILQVFQLVKANADFPNLIYILLFEREVVAAALNQISGGKGMEFLEKIIQVGYHIPHASQIAIQKILFNGLDKHIDDSPASKHWDKYRWRDLYFEGIADYFRNLRHVYRFLTSFTFHVQQHSSAQSFEVNPVDLIGLETLRVFEPLVYERLPNAKAILTREEPQKPFLEIKQETIDQGLSQIVSAATPQSQARVRVILNVLFPPLSSAFSSNRGISSHRQEWLRTLRICHPEMFDKYFTLSISDSDLSQAELDNLLANTVRADAFITACGALKKRGLLKIAFERLEAYKEHIPLQNMGEFIKALCNLGDTFPVRQLGFFETDLETHASRFVHFGLKRESDAKKRFEILRNAFTSSTGLALLLHIVSNEERINDRVANGREFLIEEKDLVHLKNICIEKLRTYSKSSDIFKNPRLDVFLWRWSEWATISEVRNWIGEHTKSADGAIWLLTVFLSELHAWGRGHKVRYYIHLPSIERFADVQLLTRLTAHVKEEKLTNKGAKAVEEFRHALKRRAEGKPDDAWRNGDEGFVEEIVEN